jgi:plasmid stabilization system protein ParE
VDRRGAVVDDENDFEVRWMPRARRQAAMAQLWWVENRTTAPTMLRGELARVISLLARHPELGIRIRGNEVRRLLLPDTEQFIYYRVRLRARRIEILALWSAARRFGPPLPAR